MARVGILEYKNEEFIQDVMARLGGLNPEYLSFQELSIPSGIRFDVIVDRMSHTHPFLREVMKNLSLSGIYVINNPYSFTVTNKIIDTYISSAMKIPHPKTVILPLIEEGDDMDGSVREPDLEKIARDIGFPCVLKPYNGFAWENVYFVNTMNELANLYNSLKDRHVLLLQEKIEYSDYYRVYCINHKEILYANYVPRPQCRGEYRQADPKRIEDFQSKISGWTTRLNRALDLDFNALEWAIDLDGDPYVIDAFNELPEVRRHQLPRETYEWLVDRFSALIREKAESGVKNKMIFSY